MTSDDSSLIPCHCWARHPQKSIRCTQEPRHRGDHFNPYARLSWDQPGTRWPQESEAGRRP